MEGSQSSDSEIPQDLNNNDEILYWEKDDVNPNQIIYDTDNDKTIIPNDEDYTLRPVVENPKFIIKDVSNTNYRNSR